MSPFSIYRIACASELHVLKLDRAVAICRNLSVLRIRNLLFRVKECEDPLTRRHGGGKLSGHLGNRCKGLLEVVDVLKRGLHIIFS